MAERMGKYWICNECAEKREWAPFKNTYTAILGLCGWCDTNQPQDLLPLQDLKNKDGVRADREKREKNG